MSFLSCQELSVFEHEILGAQNFTFKLYDFRHYLYAQYMRFQHRRFEYQNSLIRWFQFSMAGIVQRDE